MSQAHVGWHGKPLPDEKPPGGSDSDFLTLARERYERAVDADRENREEAIKDLEYLAGDQWPQELVTQRTEDGRPCLTVNRLPQFVRQVTGDLRASPPGIKVRPADSSADKETARILEGIIRHIEVNSDAKTAYQIAAEGAAGGGIGHFRITTEYSSDDGFDLDIRIRPILDHMAVVYDPDAVLPTREDGNYTFVVNEMGIESFKAWKPDVDTTGWDVGESAVRNAVGDWLSHDTVRVAEYWVKENEERTIVLLANGTVMDKEDYEEAPPTDGMGAPVAVERERKVIKKKVKMYLITGSEILEGPYEWPTQYIPIIPILGEEIYIGSRRYRHGVVRFARDPQQMYNYWRSAQVELVALQPKAPYVVTASMIAGFEDLWRQANVRNLPYLPFNLDEKNPGLRPERSAPPVGSPGMSQEIMMASEDMKATTGIYDASLGARSNETSGRAIMARQAEGDISTIAYADNTNRALRYAGRQLIALIPKIYDTMRSVRVLGEDGSSKTVTLNQTDPVTGVVFYDLSVGEYDVVSESGPSYSTRRREAAEGSMELIRNNPQLFSVIGDIVIRNLDWPGAEKLAERMEKLLPPQVRDGAEGQPQQPDPAQMAAAQAAQAQAQAVQAKAQADQMAAQAKIMVAQAQAKLAEAKAQEVGVRTQAENISVQQAQIELEEANANLQRTQARVEGERLENEMRRVELSVSGGEIERMIEKAVRAAVAAVKNGEDK